MEIILGVIIVVLAFILVLAFLYINKGGKDERVLIEQIAAVAHANEADRVTARETSRLMQQQISLLTQQLDARLDASQRGMNDIMRSQFTESQKLISEINQAMEGRMQLLAKEQSRANESVQQFAQIGEKLANLEKTLTHQKQRGAWGEASLELILDNFLAPNMYEKQYRVDDGDVVDFVIKTPDGVIPIDAKFSLDNYQRLIESEDASQREQFEKSFHDDLKKRINETSKYINEKKGTLPFAFMFIPAEAIYYDLLMNKVGRVHEQSLIDYAYREKRVVIVSPTTFMAYLQTVLFGFKAFQIEKNAQEIGKRVEELGKHLKSYEDYHTKVGKTLGTLVSHYNSSNTQLSNIDKDIRRITGDAPGIEVIKIDKPSVDDIEE